MATASRRTKWAGAFTMLVVGLLTVRCDSPVPGDVGGLVFVVRTTPAALGTNAATVRRVIITAKRVVVVYSETADGSLLCLARLHHSAPSDECTGRTT